MQSAYVDPKKKKQLEVSFGVVAAWALAADPAKFAGQDLAKIAEDAQALADLTSRHNPAEAMRRAARLVRSIDEMIDLQREFKRMPKDDPDRNNVALRTALRRITDVRNKDIWHVQLT